MNKLSKNLPTLQETINEIRSLCESEGRYEDAPHVIEILLPTVCSYLNYWWNYGPSARQQNIEQASLRVSKLEKSISVDAEKIAQGGKKPEPQGPTLAIAAPPSATVDKNEG